SYCFGDSSQRGRPAVLCRDPSVNLEDAVAVGESGIGLRELRVELDSLLKRLNCLAHSNRHPLIRKVATLEVKLVCFEILRCLLRANPQSHFELVGYCARNLVLDVEEIFQRAVVTLWPQVASVGRSNQLRGHADAVAGATYAAFENTGDAQDLGNFADIRVLTLEGESRRAGNHFEARHFDQRVDNLLG